MTLFLTILDLGLGPRVSKMGHFFHYANFRALIAISARAPFWSKNAIFWPFYSVFGPFCTIFLGRPEFLKKTPILDLGLGPRGFFDPFF